MLKLMCKKHPRYTGERSPRASCQACQEIYRIRLGIIQVRIVEIVGAKPTAKAAQSE